MNKVEMIGRLTKDVALSYTQNGKAVGRFTLAVPKKRKEDGANFIQCKAWGQMAELIERYIKKGHQCAIVGHIDTGSYEKDGHKIYTTEVVVDEVDFLEKKSDQMKIDPETSDIEHDSFQQIEQDIPY